MSFKNVLAALGLVTFLGVAMQVHSSHARSTTGFSSFRVQNPSGIPNAPGPYACLTEDNGAVVNNCAYPVNILFDLPIDSPGVKNIELRGYWRWGSGSTSFRCTSYAYQGFVPASNVGTNIVFTAAQQGLQTSVTVNGGMSITVICWSMPPGDGIANINWNP